MKTALALPGLLLLSARLSAAPQVTTTLHPVDDAEVSQASPDTNAGLASALRVRGEQMGTLRSYLRFDLSGLSGTVTAARLRLHCTESSLDGGRLFDNLEGAWTESAVTWSNRPQAGSLLAELGPVTAGQWVEIEVAPLAYAAGRGNLELALGGPSDDLAGYSSAEGAHPPELVVTTVAGTVHPFLMTRPSEAPALRVRSLQGPWRALADEALRYAATQSFDPGASDWQAKTRMTDLCGALALAYVLDPRTAYVDKLRETLDLWPAYFDPSAPQGGYTQVRWQQSAMVQSILALDVLHDALGTDTARFEAMIDSMVGTWWANLDRDGTTSTPGITAIWALYRGDRPLFEQARALFLARFFGELAPSGLYDVGPGYGLVRQAGDRISKYALLDVLQFTGEDATIYSDPRMVGLHTWLFAGACTPRRTNLTFGDSDPSRPIEALQGYVPGYRAGLVSPRAGRNAAWLLRDVDPKPILMNFVLMNGTILEPEPPTSTLWGDTASFWEDATSVDSLMGALWCPRSSGGHSHKDVNAVHLYAYGENVLRNSGYCGAGQGIDALFDWDWVSDTAASSNTLSIGGADHARKSGAGVLEGLTAPRFDYAAAGSGDAIPGGTHTRSLLLVHGEPGRPGYFVLLDEARAVAGAEVCVDLHPDSSAVTVASAGTEYDWSIRRFGDDPVQLTVFLATPPAQVQLLDGGLCAFDGKDYVARYLHACHAADARGQAHLVTVLLPATARHPRPAITRLSGGATFTGARIDHPDGTDDVVAEARGDVVVGMGPAVFRGLATHYRVSNGVVRQYFLRRGSVFDDGRPARTGLESDQELTAFVRGTEAHVVSAGATVDFYDPTLAGQSFETSAGTVLGAGPGFVRIRLNAGSHAFDLRTGAAR